MIIFFFFFFFNDKLRLLRKEKNLTISELSKEVGIPTSTLSMYEQGKRNPSMRNLEILANFFDVPQTELYNVKQYNDEKQSISYDFNRDLLKHGITEEAINDLPSDKRELLFRIISDIVKTLTK